MRIAIGCDDAGFPLKAAIIGALESGGHVVLDLGSFSPDPVDYPDYARVVGQAVLRGFAEGGVLVCGSGVGAAIAANKLRTVRAAFCPDSATARQSREQEDSNVLCLHAGALDTAAAIDVALTWVATPFSADESHARRVAKIAQLEDGQGAAERPATPAAAGPAAMAPSAPSSAAAAPPPSATTAPSDAASIPTAAPAPASAPTAPPATVSPVPAAATPAAAESAPRTAAPSPPAPAAAPPPPLGSPSGPASAASAATDAAQSRPVADALSVPLVEQTLGLLESQSFLDRLWNKDAALWKGDPELVKNRLGWLTAPTVMRSHADDLRLFADESRRLQFSQVLVLGVGGAALATELWSRTFGSKMGFPDLLALDSTHPGAVRRVLERINVPRTLFVVASKSGKAPETLALYRFFRELVDAARPPKPGLQFIAVTDPGTPLDTLARDSGFRHTFLEPPTIGGRFASLAFSALLPAAMIGVDVKTLLERARVMVDRCGASARVHESPALRLGAALAVLARAGRDKVTFVLSERIRPLGAWLEQLLAQSLGKDGKGVIPVIDEPLGPPPAYGADRVFVAMTLEGDKSHDAALAALAEAGHPVIRLRLTDPLDVGGEFFRWQLAVATAGAVLGVNPFDEPDADRVRERAAGLFGQWKRSRRLPEWRAAVLEDDLALFAKTDVAPASVAQGVVAHLAQAQAGDYLAIQAYLDPSAEVWSTLQALRTLLRDRLRLATTLGLGPRYLHTAGQLHKGGPPRGIFVQITGEDDALPSGSAGADLAGLTAAQALADLEALHEGGRRVVRLHIAGKPVAALQRLLQTIRGATRRL